MSKEFETYDVPAGPKVKKTFGERLLACKAGDVVELKFENLPWKRPGWTPRELNNGGVIVKVVTDKYLVVISIDGQGPEYVYDPKPYWEGTCKKIGRARMVMDVTEGDPMVCWNGKVYIGCEMYEGKKLLKMFQAVAYTLGIDVK